MQNQERGDRPAKLVIFGGLPGVGKSSIARVLAQEIGAVYLRIDSIEQALRDSGSSSDAMNDAGYCIAYALAAENLRIGLTVVADSVNPILITRHAWRDVAQSVGVKFLEVEVRCSDAAEHRRRVENRKPDIPSLVPPTWEQVQAREYEAWDRDHLTVDTATDTPEQIVGFLRSMLGPG